jgi:NAD(P)-dependent dehydrogenase (short-subunit alcohol dehydrogenase family)
MIVTPFSRTSTAADVVAGHDLSRLRAVVTGGGSGIGLEVSRALAGAGAEVVAAQRRMPYAALPDGVRHAPLDLADLTSVAAFGAGWEGPLHLLVNNAGVMAVPTLTRTAAGHELQLAVNHLGHQALAQALLPALRAAGAARVVAVSSSAHLTAPVDLDDPDFERTTYDPWLAYGRSKSANVLFAVEATRRWSGDGIVANAVMPGGVMTGLQQHVPAEVRAEWAELPATKTPQQGAATTLVAAVAPELAGLGGRYLEDGGEAAVDEDDVELAPDAISGVRRWALDPATAERWWEVSESLLTR